MRRIVADLHIHTSLSPCADPGMGPAAIVERALELGLEVIAICDHNSAANVWEVRRAAGSRLGVVAGAEITTAEEVHVVALFPDADAAPAITTALAEHMPDPPTVNETAGHRLRRLIGSTTLTLSQTVDWIHARGGLAIAAHVDRKAFSVVGQLGFLPVGVCFDALEISAAGMRGGKAQVFAARGIPLVSSSDSHSLGEMGASSTVFTVVESTVRELGLALRGQGGRCAVGQVGVNRA